MGDDAGRTSQRCIGKTAPVRRPSFPAHFIVGLIVVAAAVLALVGLVGSPSRPERFDAKRYVVMPAGEEYPDGIRVDQVIDQDFGTNDRHGFQLNVSNSYGAATEVRAESADAPDALDVVNTGESTRIRIGDPDTTITGQHRYELSYVQPTAGIEAERLELDVIYTGEQFETERFEVVVNGFELDGATCTFGGSEFDQNTCELAPADDGTLRTVIAPLERGDGILITGDITATTTPATLDAPPLPDEAPDRRVLTALLMALTGAATAAVVYAALQRAGRNEVFAGGAANAASMAFGDGALPPPGVETTLVSDARLGDLATIEFVPPKTITPWEAALLLREQTDDRSVGAWFSAQAGDDVITMSRDGDDELVLAQGPKYAQADVETRGVLSEAFNGREQLTLDKYDERFASAWDDVRTMQNARLADSGWWKRPPSAAGSGGGSARPAGALVGGAIFALFLLGSSLSFVLALFRSLPGGLVFAALAAGIAAYIAYKAMLPSRSALGSALTLRAESFRRFLDQSEGRHVEWAWENGLIRQYSAWAVALGAADAWQRALASSNVPHAEYQSSGPMMVYAMGPSFHQASHEPVSTGSGGGFSGGGFSGGSVGGGGGGGGSSSGSW